jgi:hypothetical protein
MALALAMTQNKTGAFALTLTQSDGSVLSIVSGMVIYFHAAYGTFTIEKFSPSDGITVTDAAGGLATLQIEPADTAGLTFTGVVIMPCELTLTYQGEAYELDSGFLTVTEAVGTP